MPVGAVVDDGLALEASRCDHPQQQDSADGSDSMIEIVSGAIVNDAFGFV